MIEIKEYASDHITQMLHVAIRYKYILWRQKGSHITILGPKYIPYS